MLLTILSILFQIISFAIRIYSFVWFIWIILSWLRAFGAIQLDPFNPLLRLLRTLTDGVVDSVFGNFRRYLVIGMFDLSPLVFLLVLTSIFPRVLAWLFNMILRNFG